jgi:hypothetical protein
MSHDKEEKLSILQAQYLANIHAAKASRYDEMAAIQRSAHQSPSKIRAQFEAQTNYQAETITEDDYCLLLSQIRANERSKKDVMVKRKKLVEDHLTSIRRSEQQLAHFEIQLTDFKNNSAYEEYLHKKQLANSRLLDLENSLFDDLPIKRDVIKKSILQIWKNYDECYKLVRQFLAALIDQPPAKQVLNIDLQGARIEGSAGAKIQAMIIQTDQGLKEVINEIKRVGALEDKIKEKDELLDKKNKYISSLEAKIEQGKQNSIAVNLQTKQTVKQAQKEMYVKVLDVGPEILSQPTSTLSALIVASNYLTPEVAEKIILEYEQLTEQVIKQTDQEMQRMREYADKQCAEQLEKQRNIQAKIQVEHAEQCEKKQAKHYRKMNRLMKGLVRMEDEDEALDDYSAAPVDSESDDDLRKLATSAQKGHLKELSESQRESTVLSSPLQTRGGYSPRIRFDVQKSGTKPADIIQAENCSLKDLASCVLGHQTTINNVYQVAVKEMEEMIEAQRRFDEIKIQYDELQRGYKSKEEELASSQEALRHQKTGWSRREQEFFEQAAKARAASAAAESQMSEQRQKATQQSEEIERLRYEVECLIKVSEQQEKSHAEKLAALR